MSQKALADAIGVRQPSIQALETGRAHGTKHLHALAKALGQDPDWLLTGAGEMRSRSEGGKYTLTMNPPSNAEPAAAPLPRPNQMPLDVPVYGVAVGGDAGDFSLNGDVVDRVRRPPGLIGNRSAFAVYVRGDSMEPRHYQGDLLYVDPIRPARSGDDVLVELRPGRPGEPGPAYIKQLVTQGPVRVVLRQFNPAKDITLPGAQILRVSKILKLADLLGI